MLVYEFKAWMKVGKRDKHETCGNGKQKEKTEENKNKNKKEPSKITTICLITKWLNKLKEKIFEECTGLRPSRCHGALSQL